MVSDISLKRLRRVLLKGGELTQTQVASEFGVSEATVTRWLDGTRRMLLPRLKQICEVRGVSADYLLCLGDSQGALKVGSVGTHRCIMIPRIKHYRLLIEKDEIEEADIAERMPFDKEYIEGLLGEPPVDDLRLVWISVEEDHTGKPADLLLDLGYDEMKDGSPYMVIDRETVRIGVLHTQDRLRIFTSERPGVSPLVLRGQPLRYVIGRVLAVLRRES